MGKKSSKKQKKKLAEQNSSSQTKLVSKNGFFQDRKKLMTIGVILLFSFLIFLPSLDNSYVYWDDDRNFIDNIHVNSENNSTFWGDVINIFKPSNHVIGNYNPLSTASFRVENAIFGMEDSSWKWWHLDNVLLHLLCVFFVFRIALLLKLNHWGAVALALLFAIHPMRVESVVWLTERKDVLFASFYLAALYYYIKGKLADNPSKHLWLILVLFILSCLSKIQAVSLPLSMMAIDYYMDDKFRWKQVFNKWHYLLISFLIGILGVYTLSLQGSIGGGDVRMSFFQRLFIGSYSYCIYIMKFIFPYEMIPVYAYPSSLKTIFYLSALPFFGFVAFIIWAFTKKWKAIVFGALFFTVNIMFLLQIVGAGQGFKADRFTYVAYFGFFFIAAYYIQKIKFNTLLGKIITGLLLVYFAFLSFKTIQQTKIWKDSYTMWTHVIKYSPNTTLPWGNRANFLRDQGRNTEALADYNERLKLDQIDSKPFNSRGKLFFNSSNRDTLLLALKDYSKAIEISPTDDEYYVNRGSTYARLGDMQKALADYNKANEINPDNFNAYYNRSIVFHMLGEFQKELNDLESYMKYRPNNADMIGNMALAKRLVGRANDAEADFNRAISLKASPSIMLERAKNYIELRKFEEAKNDIRTLQNNQVPVPAELLQLLGM